MVCDRSIASSYTVTSKRKKTLFLEFVHKGLLFLIENSSVSQIPNLTCLIIEFLYFKTIFIAINTSENTAACDYRL